MTDPLSLDQFRTLLDRGTERYYVFDRGKRRRPRYQIMDSDTSVVIQSFATGEFESAARRAKQFNKEGIPPDVGHNHRTEYARKNCLTCTPPTKTPKGKTMDETTAPDLADKVLDQLSDAPGFNDWWEDLTSDQRTATISNIIDVLDQYR